MTATYSRSIALVYPRISARQPSWKRHFTVKRWDQMIFADYALASWWRRLLKDMCPAATHHNYAAQRTMLTWTFQLQQQTNKHTFAISHKRYVQVFFCCSFGWHNGTYTYNRVWCRRKRSRAERRDRAEYTHILHIAQCLKWQENTAEVNISQNIKKINRKRAKFTPVSDG